MDAMNDTTNLPKEQRDGLPEDLHLLQLPDFSDPTSLSRPNRICICISDLHFTDGTVGNQSADAVVWSSVFETIMDVCVNEEAEELHLILAGDVVDMIRSSRWVEAGLYPWDREREEYRTSPEFRAKYDGVLHEIMQGIIQLHAQPPAPGTRPGFFHLLKQLPKALKTYAYENSTTGAHRKSRIRHVSTLALLGNHDKEVLVNDAVLKLFYDQCLGQPFEPDTRDGTAYRKWIGNMYFNDATRFLGANSTMAPWTPFYWGDPGFRLFVTHGHWRDAENNRAVRGSTPDTSWDNSDGWNLKRWQNIKFAPFTRPCWGDTVVAALLSGFMIRCKKILDRLEQELKSQEKWTPEIASIFNTLKRVLDEMDLYRPNSSATKRLLILTHEMRKKGPDANRVRFAIENEFFTNLHGWLNMKFTRDSATFGTRCIMWPFRSILNVMAFFNRFSGKAGFIDLRYAYGLIWLMEYFQTKQHNSPSLEEMHSFTAFLDKYRDYGFRIHSEGHTHIPLQEDLYFREPAEPRDRQNYSYVNFGTWRDQVQPTQQKKYRRFGVGRALVVLDKQGKDGTRAYGYYVQDITSWSDKADSWS
jgi:hypothetical protein